MSNICEACERMLKNPSTEGYQRHHASYDEFQLAVANSCFVCCRLWDSSSRRFEGWTNQYADLGKLIAKRFLTQYLFFGSLADPSSVELSLRFGFLDEKSHYFKRIGLVRCKLQPLDEYMNARSAIFPITEGTGLVTSHSSFSMDYARKWFGHCLKNHDRCRISQAKSAGQSPTRLLEIDKPSFGKIRLVTNSNTLCTGQDSTRYATLSHCWGNLDILRLTEASRQSLEDGIDLSELGRTFRDAIEVARGLDIPFIWIDAMCIIQDSKDDWLSEAPRMTSVYGGGVLCIAATSGTDTNAGLWPRVSSAVDSGPCVVALDDKQGSQKCILYAEDYHEKSFHSMPLTSRAWSVQERLLATRVLDFCATEMLWQCCDLVASETYPGGLPRGMDKYWKKKTALQCMSDHPNSDHATVPGKKTADYEGAVQREKLDMWIWIVETYSKCSLTYQHDRLVALSGIAKRINSSSDNEYFAGLWKEDFLFQLLWSGLHKRPSHSPETYRAPTWSWASVDGGVAFHIFGRGARPVCTFHGCTIQCRTPDPTAEVTGGSLRLSGYLITTRIRVKRTESELDWVMYVGGAWRENASPDSRAVLSSDKGNFSQTPIHALPIMAEDQSTCVRVGFLLLCPTKILKGQFYRFGVMVMYLDSGLVGNDCSALGKVENEQYMEYESRDESGLSAIVVI